MMQVIQFEADNVVGMRIQGKVEKPDLDQVKREVERRLERHDRIRVYVEVAEFEGMSVDAFLEDLKFGADNWNRFDKEAVVVDQVWLRKVTAMADKLVRSGFDPDGSRAKQRSSKTVLAGGAKGKKKAGCC